MVPSSRGTVVISKLVSADDIALYGKQDVVSESQADAASLAKGVPVPTGSIVPTHHETADRPGSSGRNWDLVPALRPRLGHELVAKSVDVYSPL